ncbi:MAG: DUF3085 domain-containing protein [Pigmentiphaga sp.]|uniref:DUF3085 domain-containing protein n=1 Tax=Pigmentiphaga sp. TaxID=1977564 RepID=UPI003B548F85
MSLRFRGSELRPVLNEAVAKQCRVILAKDRGVCIFAVEGERHPDLSFKRLAYAVGCNPDTDDWWDLVHAEMGYRDFEADFDPMHPAFTHIRHSTHDLLLAATATHLLMDAVPPA